MGIYTSENIFGIRIYNFINDISNILYEEIYDDIISHHQMKEAYLYYTQINDKNNINFQIYTECNDTYNNKVSYMKWYPLSSDTFLDKFNV